MAKITLCAFVPRNAALYAGIVDTLLITAPNGMRAETKNPADKQPYTRIRNVCHTSCEAGQLMNRDGTGLGSGTLRDRPGNRTIPRAGTAHQPSHRYGLRCRPKSCADHRKHRLRRGLGRRPTGQALIRSTSRYQQNANTGPGPA